MKRPASFTLFLLLLFFSSGAMAQDTLRTRYGGFASFDRNIHSTDFRALPGVPNCCPLFTTGSGNGFDIGALFEVPIGRVLFAGARLGFMDHSGTLSATEATTVIVGTGANPVSQSGVFTHTVSATISTIGVEPTIGARLVNALTVSAGLRAGFVLGSTFSQREVTSVGTFVDANGNDTKSAVRNQVSGSIPNHASVLLHAIVAIGYELPVNPNRTTYLVPEVSYAPALNNVVKDLQWKASALTFGIALKFSPKPPPLKQHIFDTTVVRDTVTKFVDALIAPTLTLQSKKSERRLAETDVISELTTIHETYLRELTNPHLIKADVKAIGLDENGIETPMATLQIEEFLEVRAHPTLSFVFFSKDSSGLPDRYESLTRAEAKKYSLNALFTLNDIEVHHSVLNIIGKRLLDYPKANIVITGCNSDVESEHDNLALSKLRAENVRQYFSRTWGIDQSRMKTEARGLPEIPSASRSEDGQAENRRVEITSTDPDITDVFTAADTIRVPSPPQIRFQTSYASAAPVQSWKLVVIQSGRTLKEFANQGPPPKNVDWDLTYDQKNAPRFNAPLELQITLKTAAEASTANGKLPTQVRTIQQKRLEHANDTTIDKYNLVLFNFGKSDITPAHERVIAAVKSRLTPKSHILVEGFTDRTGNSVSNQRLAASRAASTTASLGRKDAQVVGVGDQRLLFPNDTPEGRFLCRTVQITVKTPTQ